MNKAHKDRSAGLTEHVKKKKPIRISRGWFSGNAHQRRIAQRKIDRIMLGEVDPYAAIE